MGVSSFKSCGDGKNFSSIKPSKTKTHWSSWDKKEQSLPFVKSNLFPPIRFEHCTCKPYCLSWLLISWGRLFTGSIEWRGCLLGLLRGYLFSGLLSLFRMGSLCSNWLFHVFDDILPRVLVTGSSQWSLKRHRHPSQPLLLLRLPTRHPSLAPTSAMCGTPKKTGNPNQSTGFTIISRAHNKDHNNNTTAETNISCSME